MFLSANKSKIQTTAEKNALVAVSVSSVTDSVHANMNRMCWRPFKDLHE